MELNVLNQNRSSMNLYSLFTSNLGSNFSGNSSNNSYYAKKGEPGYCADMDSDGDGVVSYEDFRNYCKQNNISNEDMSKMLQLRMAYQMTKDVTGQIGKSDKKEESSLDSFELIYAEENDSKYDEEQDANGDAKVTYEEYLRYCEQTARMGAKFYNTKIRQNDKSKFMTVSYGKIANSYNNIEQEVPEGKVINIA